MRVRTWIGAVGSLILGVAVSVAVIVLVATLVRHDRYQHLGQHLAIGLGLAVVLAASIRVWPPARPGAERWFRWTIQGAVAAGICGQVMEAIGAFGFALDDGYTQTNQALANVHDIGLAFGPLGMLALLVGLLGTAGTWGSTLIRRRRSSD